MSEWQQLFDATYPGGAKCLLGELLFHVPRVLVEDASPGRLDLFLWPLDFNDQQPFVVTVEERDPEKPSTVFRVLEGPTQDSQLELVDAFPPALERLRDEWLKSGTFDVEEASGE